MHYFNHDTTASTDMKICELRSKCGGAAVDAYWTILEIIYDTEEPLRIGGSWWITRVISSRLLTDESTFNQWINAMVEIGLIKAVRTHRDGSSEYTSERVTQNIQAYKQKAETARQNGKKGGRPRKADRFSVGNPEKTREEPELKLKLKLNSTGFDSKQNPMLAVGGAANREADSAPAENVTPYCSKCGLAVSFKPLQGKFECMTHGLLDREEVVFRG